MEVTLLRDQVPSFEEYPYALPAIRHLTTLKLHPAVTFIVVENATGKSTLLEAIAVALRLNPEGGSKNFNFSTRSSHSDLHEHLLVSRSLRKVRDAYFLRAESFYNVASSIEEMDKGPGGPPIISYYGGTSLHEQSHGEAFFALFNNRLGGDGIYILDEPEAALSPLRQMRLLVIMKRLVDEGSQFIVATHSPIILATPTA
jgi:predicted ATPase